MLCRIFSEEEISEIKQIKFKDVILAATNIPSDAIQENVFTWKNGRNQKV